VLATAASRKLMMHESGTQAGLLPVTHWVQRCAVAEEGCRRVKCSALPQHSGNSGALEVTTTAMERLAGQDLQSRAAAGDSWSKSCLMSLEGRSDGRWFSSFNDKCSPEAPDSERRKASRE
jgi:hypothetical protein